MKHFRHMTWTDRLLIEKHYNAGMSYRAMSQLLGFSVSNIHREVHCGLYDYLDGQTWISVKRYSAEIADNVSKWKASSRCTPIKLDKNYDYAALVAERIHAGESPDSIVGDLKVNGEWTVSTNTLYRYIDRGYIPGITNKDLLIKSTRKRTYYHVRAAKPPKGTSIEKRPPHIWSRSVPGHWEMDTVIGKSKGKRQTLLVLTERCSRYELIYKLADKTADSVCRKLEAVLPTFPDGTFKTITVDNGTEFSDPCRMEALGVKLYYCHPYNSCERGSNENANKIIRRFLPKHTSLYHVTQRQCDHVAHWMNHMHRKILNYQTAFDIFTKWQAQLL